MAMTIEDGLIEVQTLTAVGASTSATLIHWATAALEAGWDTPALRVLAGLPTTTSWFEGEAYFQRSLAELGIIAPSGALAQRAYIGVASRRVLAGDLSAREALDLVHRYAVSPLDYPRDLRSWSDLWEELVPCSYESVTPEQQEELVRQLAREAAALPTGVSRTA